jgi:hypothetical protein
MRVSTKSEAEAERIIASVWLALERTSTPSPYVAIKPQGDKLLIDFAFRQRSHELTIIQVLWRSSKCFGETKVG